MKEEIVEKTQKRKLNESIINIRVKLQNAKLKKTGKNKFAGFDYFELADFLPKLNELMLEENINDKFVIEKDEAKLTLIKGNESQEYVIPFVLFDTPLNKDGKPSMAHIQNLGALNTYYKRYLYMNAFGITDGEVIDALDNTNLINDTTNYREKLIEYCKINSLDMSEIAKEYKINSTSNQFMFKKVIEDLEKKQWNNGKV